MIQHQPTLAPPAIPPLNSGDHLSRAEFERRYDAMPGLKRASSSRGLFSWHHRSGGLSMVNLMSPSHSG